MVQQQDANGLSADAGDQSAFDRFLRHEPHAPPRLAFWWITAYHGDDALFLGGIQHLDGARALFLIQGAIQSNLLIAVAEASNRLRGQRDRPGNLRSTGMLR